MTKSLNSGKLSWGNIIRFVVPVAVSVAVVILLRMFVLGSFSIPSTSMEPTLKVGDITLVNYLDKDPVRGDVVVFKDDNGWLEVTGHEGVSQFMVKRVAAVGGDSIEGRDGKILVNGKEADTRFLNGVNVDFPRQEVPEGSFFMLGDNREYSADSRFHIMEGNQFVKQESIAGTAFFAVTFSPFDMRPIVNG